MSSFNWHGELFWIHCSLAESFFGEGRFDDAHTHIERAKLPVINDGYRLGRVMQLQAQFWCGERKFVEAKSETLRAMDAYETVGATKDVEDCRDILRYIEGEMEHLVVSGD